MGSKTPMTLVAFKINISPFYKQTFVKKNLKTFRNFIIMLIVLLMVFLTPAKSQASITLVRGEISDVIHGIICNGTTIKYGLFWSHYDCYCSKRKKTFYGHKGKFCYDRKKILEFNKGIYKHTGFLFLVSA